jgi:hypothetical protein
MSNPVVTDKLIEWVQLLHENGAVIFDPDGKTADCNPVIRLQISAMHATLAGGDDNDAYQALEDAFEAAWTEANELAAATEDGEPGPLIP